MVYYEGWRPEGLIVANDTEPIRTGGENRSKDLYGLYKAIKIIQMKQKILVISNLKGKEYW